MGRKALVIAVSVAALAVAAAAVWRVSSSARAAASAATSEDGALAAAAELEARGEFQKSQEAYRKFIEAFPSSGRIQKAQEAAEGLNVRMLFSRAATPGSSYYEAQKGDNLTKIAKKFGTTVDLIARSNGITDGSVRAGRPLKVPSMKFSIAIDKSQNILTLKADGNAFKTYRVSTGKPATPTPAGSYVITSKIVDPPWYPPNGKMIPSGDPRNVLGSRWLGLSKPSYGIHGTVDSASIGTSVTEGCVRLNNRDVEELFSIVPEGTEVVIVD
jgi:lipoprotein-anchoring transpeptidase ErfK/SrfK